MAAGPDRRATTGGNEKGAAKATLVSVLDRVVSLVAASASLQNDSVQRRFGTAGDDEKTEKVVAKIIRIRSDSRVFFQVVRNVWRAVQKDGDQRQLRDRAGGTIELRPGVVLVDVAGNDGECCGEVARLRRLVGGEAREAAVESDFPRKPHGGGGVVDALREVEVGFPTRRGCRRDGSLQVGRVRPA